MVVISNYIYIYIYYDEAWDEEAELVLDSTSDSDQEMSLTSCLIVDDRTHFLHPFKPLVTVFYLNTPLRQQFLAKYGPH